MSLKQSTVKSGNFRQAGKFGQSVFFGENYYYILDRPNRPFPEFHQAKLLRGTNQILDDIIINQSNAL